MKKMIGRGLTSIAMLLTAAVVIMVAGCSREEIGAVTPVQEKITVSATMPDGATMRIAYDDERVGSAEKDALTWQEGDTIAVVGMKENRVKGIEMFCLTSGAGTTAARFTGNAIPNATSYHIYYPGKKVKIANDGTATLEMQRQQQTVNGSTEHLRDCFFLQKRDLADLDTPFSFELGNAVIKFQLTDLPVETGSLKKMVWGVEAREQGTRMNVQVLEFAPDAVTINETNRTVTAYLAFMPSQVQQVRAGGKFQVCLIGDRSYMTEVTSPAGKSYEAGKRYCAELSEWTPTAAMSFTIETSYANRKYYLYFSDNFPASMMIDWGDGCYASAVMGMDGDEAESMHAYAHPGIYTVSLISAQPDASLPQLPKMRLNANNNLYGGLRYIRFDTPLLHINTTDFSSFFSHLSTIQSIPETLFVNNAQATDFSGCFDGCTALTALPEGLFSGCTQATDFSGCFDGCTALTALPEGLFSGCTQATDFRECFTECTALTALPAGLFSGCTQAYNLYGCFRGCTALTTLPEGLFSGCTGTSDFSSCFSGCRGLTAIPGALFSDCTQASNFSYCFSGCRGLTEIPGTLFSNCTSATRFSACFLNCTNVTTIPATLFANNRRATDFGGYGTTGSFFFTKGCFEGCTALVTIPDGLFSACKEADKFSYCFSGCTALTALSGDIFSGCEEASDFTNCFSGCTALTDISGDLFSGCSKALYFTACFSGCTELQTISGRPFIGCSSASVFSGCFSNCSKLNNIQANLFAECTRALKFNGCFQNCKSLTAIPEDLFANNRSVQDFGTNYSVYTGCFAGCTNLQSIPANLFAACVNVENFAYCFHGCTALTAISEGLFDANGKATNFSDCFNGCTALTAIPEGLFDANSKATSFSNCFNGCTALTTVPEGLFDKNSNAVWFGSCFKDCTSLVMNKNIFSKEGKVDRFKDKRVSFSSCFYNAGYNTTRSYPPELWKYEKGSGYWFFYDCFTDANIYTDSSYNPSQWGVPKP